MELALILFLAALCIALIFTAERWLLAVLNILDKALVRLGVGTWSAKILTGAENWVAARTARKARRKSQVSKKGSWADWAGSGKERDEMEEHRRKIEEVVRAFAEHWNQHDMEAFARLFAEDAEFVNVVGMWWTGREEIKRAHETTHASIFKKSHLKIDEIKVRFVRPEVAVARSRWELTGHVGPGGEALPARRGVLMNLIVPHDGQWTIIDSQNTDIVEGVLAPPQEAAPR
jgi:uncharacterized protein (TIGR02246 family)